MILLKLMPSIKGDCVIKGFEDWISCTSIDWALNREFKESSKAGSKDLFTGVAEIPPIEIAKSFDKASVNLMKFACGGGVLCPSGEILLLTTGEDMDNAKNNWYLRFKLDSPIVAKWSISGAEDERPNEKISLWYYKIQLTYRSFDGKTFHEEGTRGWDRIGSKAWDA